jgi:hypothetical protein
MDFVFWIILIVVAVGVVWWLLKRNSSSKGSGAAGSSEGRRSDGALSGGSAAASAEAAGTTGIATAAGFGRPAEPAAPTTADEHAAEVKPAAPEVSPAQPADTRGHEGPGPIQPHASATGAPGAEPAREAPDRDERRLRDDDEWETKWSEASGSSAVTPAGSSAGASGTATPARTAGATPDSAAPGRSEEGRRTPEQGGLHAEPAAPAAASRPVHHPEYTAPQAPTLPGAESAAVEEAYDAGGAAPGPAGTNADNQPVHAGTTQSSPGTGVVPGEAAAAETADRTQSSAVVESGADHSRQPQAAAMHEPAGHLAADEPYGAGSAAASADGSGPADYTVKGDAGAMVYYEEGHPGYEEARAEVWFESAAHAEAAGFRAPRRRRL